MERSETLYRSLAVRTPDEPVSPLAKCPQASTVPLYSPDDASFATATAATATRKPSVIDKVTLCRFTLLCFTLCAPPIVLICWALTVFHAHHLNFWLSAPIGGQFSQIVAKGIDFFCGAIVAPLVMATVSLAWFSFARTGTYNVDPGHQNSASLKSFLEMSTTSGGSYDPWKLWNIFRPKNVRFRLFSALVLFTAITTSFFVNVIAYEGFIVNQEFYGNATLRYLKNPYTDYKMDNTYYMSAIPLERREGSSLAVSYATIMNSIGFGVYTQDHGQMWSPAQFISANTTKKSLEGLSDGIRELKDVPAFRKTLSCKPANISAFSVAAETTSYISISVTANDTSFHPEDDPNFITRIPGELDNIETMAGQRHYLTLFSMNRTRPKVFLGVLDRSPFNKTYTLANHTNYTMPENQVHPSEFGDLPISVFLPNESIQGVREFDYGTYSTFGILCELLQQTGHTNLTLDRNGTRNWNVTSSTFEEASIVVPDRLFNFQDGYLQPPPQEAQMSGLHSLGSVLGAPLIPDNGSFWPEPEVNMSTFANNFLFAAGAMESTLINTALINSTRLQTAPEYTVNGSQEVIKYRITYIPGILIFGLIGLTICAAIALGMTIHSWRIARSVWAGQMVDGLRFVADFAPVMKGEDRLTEADVEDRAKLEKWGKELKLVYVVEDGKQCLRLRKDIDGGKA